MRNRNIAEYQKPCIDTSHRCAWTLPEGTALIYNSITYSRLLVIYTYIYIYTDVAKTTMGSFGQVKTAFSSNSCKPLLFSLLAATLAKFFNEEIF